MLCRIIIAWCFCMSWVLGQELRVFVTVDWEGDDLTPTNLNSFARIRKDYPQIPMTQYLNAAYYTKTGSNSAEITRKIKSVLKESDEVGLHIHGWRSLVEASGVTFKDSPAFNGASVYCSAAEDCGHEVPISVYSVTELQKIISHSIDLLGLAGFSRPTSFRSGGWMSYPNVLEALVREDFSRDSSDVATSFVVRSWGEENLGRWISELWGRTTIYSQPYLSETPAGSLLQVPDNGALADYITADEMWDVIVANLSRATDSRETRNVVIGFHQETIARYEKRVRGIFSKIEAYNREHAHRTATPIRYALMRD